jgi:multicomponent Na+:H+ antiporter subunit B
LKTLQILLLLSVTLLIGYGALFLPPRGNPFSPASIGISTHYIEEAERETGTPNMVTAVLADYRSFDTLGESLVIFTAGLACFFIMRKKEEDET